MILISVLCALALERLIATNARWELNFYAQWYRDKLSGEDYFRNDSSELAVWGLLLVPPLLLGIILSILPGFLDFLLHTLVLFVCLGSAAARGAYRHYMAAADRNDIEACGYHLARITPAKDILSYNNDLELGMQAGLRLLWINYQYYIGVILWFVVFGAPGALFYALVRELCHQVTPTSANVYRHIAKLMYALDFIPVRVTAFGQLVVGDFSRALPVWLERLRIIDIPASRLLSDVALAAERDLHHPPMETEKPLLHIPQTLVRLAKRNLILLIVFIALLTVYGGLS